ncbi:MAG: hypothetical protein UY31_C0017G0003 [Candidatus Wolfebacteria bacterium GW2011_GWE1_48_7]|uniref:Uncharacterized protein n=2 Tax=Candidatus Wolfeibacteriota TaxID=1752735 RepID=A0A0G1U3Q0_9BACT|nr:MAG: hypothetical protein UX70_C0001G0213 [Candidatus Wolfebacteria bacterium GW2011_GWB1_47_1]KKU36823.1 MAG: hypothetical protein UX49_C0008G0016 [Candidatus Wolfebacteria bacterium GW2011_GWC2_46_275]KKU65771.1 MAG: hypothetical protein UX90_C0002G0147 [Candidatus Wolfebacteria bacterium GW2011_GWD2_47_17]KKU73331.1 MAG: hypothetical protein UX96_C0006G0015 [Candidatus Wolfebacteria bacterium GW2011_GWB1_47_243]KKU88702.1 MAG: hypothetical protein UY19_C0025G0004 [Candidatus Wolfebacteria
MQLDTSLRTPPVITLGGVRECRHTTKKQPFGVVFLLCVSYRKIQEYTGLCSAERRQVKNYENS